MTKKIVYLLLIEMWMGKKIKWTNKATVLKQKSPALVSILISIVNV
uniref:Uncharacterized protein n=1 Tax=Rhizophora mucronata TaxID=61149 RepID=A0A2P2LBM8_RHIMU